MVVLNILIAYRYKLTIFVQGGKYFYMEHVIGPKGSFTRALQKFVAPVWKFFMCGCTVKGEPWNNLDRAGFSEVKYEHLDIDFRKESFYTNLIWLLVIRPIFMGYAMK